MIRRWPTLALVLLAPAVHAQEPQWLLDARAREGAPVKVQAIASEDRSVRARVSATLASPITIKGEVYMLSLAVGAPSAMECAVRKKATRLASFLYSTRKPSFDVIADAQGAIEVSAVERTDAGAVGASPFIALDWIYRVNRDGAQQLGALKQFVANKDDASIYCALNEIGYTSTFERVAHELLTTLDTGQNTEKAHYREVALLSMGDKHVGVGTIRLVRNKDGTSRSEQETHMLVQVGPGLLQAIDETDVTQMRKDGTMISAVAAAYENDEANSSLELQPGGSGWQVSGTFKGKEISASWPDQPDTWLDEVRQVRKRLREPESAGASITTNQWLPSIDPTKLLESSNTIQGPAENGLFAVSGTVAGMQIDSKVDPRTGSPVVMTMQMGPVSMTVERIFSDGSY